MEQFLTNLPNTPLGWIALFFTGVVSALVFINTVRRNDLTTLRDSNKDLRDALADNEKKLNTLEERVNLLRAELKVLEGKNKTLQELVATALKEYFVDNPKIAIELNQKLAS